MLPITTARLVLRDFVEADWADVQEYASDPEVCRHMVWGPNTPEQTKAFIASTLPGQVERPRRKHELAIVMNGKVIGGARLDIHNVERGEADLGYTVARPLWSRGIATEAARALLKAGFGELKLHRIFATCSPENAASSRVLEKIGMQREGLMREHILIKGRWRDSLLYAVLDRDWNAIA